MSLRIKFTILFLLLSLGPLFLLRCNGQYAIHEMGEELAAHSRNALTERATDELDRLVQGHAMLLKREDNLIHFALMRNARAIADYMTGLQRGEADYFIATRDGDDPPGAEEDDAYMGSGHRMIPAGPLAVNHDMLAFVVPGPMHSTVPDANMTLEMQRLAPMAGLHHQTDELLDDLVIWSVTALEDGLAYIHPAHGHVPGLRQDPRSLPWYRETLDSGTINFSMPFRDPVTAKAVMAISVPVVSIGGDVLGVTALLVSVDTMLDIGLDFDKLSQNAETLLIHATEQEDGSTGILEIASNRRGPDMMSRRWMIPDTRNWLSSEDEQFPRFKEDIIFGRSGVRSMAYQGEPSLWAYGHVDEKGTVLLMIVPEASITAKADEAESFVTSTVNKRLRETGILMAATLLVILLTVFYLSRQLSGSVRELLDAFLRVADGDFTARAPTCSKDELGRLALTFNRMVPALEDQVRMKKALELASDVQQNLLPSSPPQLEGLELAGGSDYCDETGGDFYDYFPCPTKKGRVGVAIGDVSGHGVPAALLMASSRALLRCRADRADRPADIINDVNRILHEETVGSGRFLTLFFLTLEPGEPIRWVRAGHDPAIMYDPASDAFSELRGEGIPLGVTPDYLYEGYERDELAPGQILFLGTDGIWEMRGGGRGEMYGKQRLREVIRSHSTGPVRELRNAVLEELAAWRGKGVQDDDVTLVVIKRSA